MKALVLFDSNYGNTKVIAQVIADKLGEGSKAIAVTDFNKEMLKGINLLVAGSPILAWRPSSNMRAFLSGLPKNQLSGLKAASFDTRIKSFMSGEGSKKIASALEKAGADIISDSQAFLVKGAKGPLFEKEKEKAARWAESLKKQI